MTEYKRRQSLYTGKAKSLYATDDPHCLIMHFRDDVSAFDREKYAQLARKGIINNHINAFIMCHLKQAGIATHFIQLLSDDETLVNALQMIPLECVVRNIAAGSLCKRLGVEEGTVLEPPLFEFFLKDDALHDPLVNEDHIRAFAWADATQVNAMKAQSLQINTILRLLFQEAGMLLVDYKLEFGMHDGKIILGDEFSPDGCRIWDIDTHTRLDKDRFRRDEGDVIAAYTEVAQRLRIPLPV